MPVGGGQVAYVPVSARWEWLLQDVIVLLRNVGDFTMSSCRCHMRLLVLFVKHCGYMLNTEFTQVMQLGVYRIAGNFREVKIFAIFVTHDQNESRNKNRENLNT